MILGFAAATAICAASAGSYAAWDNVTAVSNGSIKVASRIDVSSTSMGTFSETRELAQSPFYDANATFNLSSVETALQSNMNFELSISVKNGGTEVESSAYTISVVPKDGTAITPTGNKFIDESPKFGANAAVYGVKLTLADTSAGYALAGATLEVNVTGLLVSK